MPTPPSTSNFRDYVQNPAFVPTWLRGPVASRMLMAMAAQFDWPMVKAMRASPDYAEGPLAFAEKRLPRWSSD